MAKVKIDISDYSEEILAAMKEQVALGLEACGQEAEGYAKDECPVDTGRLRNSISYATQTAHVNTDTPMEAGDDSTHATPEENSVYIGTNVEYAPYVEYRDATHKTGKAHFLRDAAATHGDRYKAIIEAALKA